MDKVLKTRTIFATLPKIEVDFEMAHSHKICSPLMQILRPQSLFHLLKIQQLFLVSLQCQPRQLLTHLKRYIYTHWLERFDQSSLELVGDFHLFRQALNEGSSIGVLNIIAMLDGFYLAVHIKGHYLLQEARLSGDKHIGLKRLVLKVWLASSLLSWNYPINRAKMK